MARDSDDTITPAAALWLLSRTLDFVTDCLQSEPAAKKYLLDYFATKVADDPLKWSYERCRIDGPETTRLPEMRKRHLDPIQPGSPDPGTIQRFFWGGQDIKGARYEIDWQAGDATYEGPLIEVRRYRSSSGWREGPMFNGLWRIKIRIELIREHLSCRCEFASARILGAWHQHRDDRSGAGAGKGRADNRSEATRTGAETG